MCVHDELRSGALISVLVGNPTSVGGTLGGLRSAASSGMHSKLKSVAYTDNFTYCVGGVGVVTEFLSALAVKFIEIAPRICGAVASNPTSDGGTVGRLRSAASCSIIGGSMHG